MPFAERFGLRTHVGHAGNDTLLAIVAGGDATPHVAACAACQARLRGLREWADAAAREAGGLAADAFTPERLAAQKKEILRRLEQAGRSARVIAFPAGAPVSRPRDSRQVLRWAAAAACVGLIVGLSAGRLLDSRRAGGQPRVASSATAPIPAGASSAGTGAAADEAALLDAAYDRVAIDALQAIDDITPRARETVLAAMPGPRR